MGPKQQRGSGSRRSGCVRSDLGGSAYVRRTVATLLDQGRSGTACGEAPSRATTEVPRAAEARFLDAPPRGSGASRPRRLPSRSVLSFGSDRRIISSILSTLLSARLMKPDPTASTEKFAVHGRPQALEAVRFPPRIGLKTEDGCWRSDHFRAEKSCRLVSASCSIRLAAPGRLATLLPQRGIGLARWSRALSAPQTLIGDGSKAEFVDQVSDAAFDVVADGADGRGVETSGVVQVVPGFVAFAREAGAGIAAAHGDRRRRRGRFRRSRVWGTRWRCRCLVRPWRRWRRG
jgi:hypothetical protein